MVFLNRVDAGRILANRLLQYKDRDDVLVLALPRGGVPVAYEIAKVLNVPMDIFVVRKLGVPGHEELAMGAIGSGAARIINENIVRPLRIPESVITRVAQREQQELERREKLYRGDRPVPEIRGKTVIVVDDGLATGASMMAAIAALRQLQPERIVVAVPVAPPETLSIIRGRVDEILCHITPEHFSAVGIWYHDFEQTTDDEVRELLNAA